MVEGNTVAAKNIQSAECRSTGSTTASPIFESQDTRPPMMKGAYLIVRKRKKDCGGKRNVYSGWFEFGFE